MTSTITMDTDCGRTPLEHLRAIEATANNLLLHKKFASEAEEGAVMHELHRCKIRIELFDALITLERTS